MKRLSSELLRNLTENSDSDLDDFQTLDNVDLKIKKLKISLALATSGTSTGKIDIQGCEEVDFKTLPKSRRSEKHKTNWTESDESTDSDACDDISKVEGSIDITRKSTTKLKSTNAVKNSKRNKAIKATSTKNQKPCGAGNKKTELNRPCEILTKVISISDESDEEFKNESSKTNIKSFDIFSPSSSSPLKSPNKTSETPVTSTDKNKSKISKSKKSLINILSASPKHRKVKTTNITRKMKENQSEIPSSSNPLKSPNKTLETPVTSTVKNNSKISKSKRESTSPSSASPKHRKVKRTNSNRKMKGNKSESHRNISREEGCCPFCQMPFAALGIQSPNWHSMECMDLPIISTEECEHGIECNSTIPSHYRRYKHDILASYKSRQSARQISFSDDCKPSDNSLHGSNKHGTSISTLKLDDKHVSNQTELDTLASGSDLDYQLLDSDSSESPAHNNNNSQSDGSRCLNVFTAESDEDIFNAETPETPNFFSSKEKSKNVTEAPTEDLGNKLTDAGGGFLASNEEASNNLDTLVSACSHKTQLSPFSGVQSKSMVNDIVDLCNQISDNSNNIQTITPSSVLSGTTKQTSLFSFFGSKCQKANGGQILKIKFVESEKTVARKSFSQLRKVKSDPWGSLRRPQKVSKSLDENTSEESLINIPSLPAADSSENDYKNGRPKPRCPFYKKIPDTGFTVDAFRYGDIPGCTVYILTHFHYDHYCGLTRKFKHPIYCSRITGNLIESKLKIESQYIKRLPMNEPCMVEGVELILREANHCPGAVIIFMRLPSGRLILHTGDYRAHSSMEEYPELRDNHINDLYLDTTYCNPDYAFPFQQDVINLAIRIATKAMDENPKTCIVCGTYTIGKERVFKAIAKAIDSKVCVKKDKKSILDCLEDEELNKMVTLNPVEASVHVLPMKLLNFNCLCDYLEKHPQFTRILVFEPTGWTHSKKVLSLDHIQPKYSRNAITHYGIPYSEHSSFLELKQFVQFLKPTRILPTVNNGSPASRRKMENLFADWLKEAADQGPQKQFPKQSSLTDSMD